MKPFRERSPYRVGAVSVAVISALFVFAFSINRFPFITRVYLLQADFADAAGLVPENEVRVAGLKVGKVRSIELVRDRVRVTFEVRNSVKLGRDSTAEIKLKTLLGAKFMAVSPKGAPSLGSGDRIPLERTQVPFEIYQVTNETVGALGRLDAKALNDALRELAALTEDPDGNFGRAFDGLAKATAAIAERDAELQSLLEGADTLLASLSARSEQLGGVIEGGAKVLEALAARRQGLKSFVTGTDRAAAQLNALLRNTKPALDPALRALHELLQVVAAHEVAQPNKHTNAANVTRSDVEEILRVLGPASEGFARVFTQGTWANVFTESLLGASGPCGLPPPFGTGTCLT